ncbi:MAG: polysaccharide deacetylase family protein [Balneolaceae bacterium]|nr:polysaccharide deacetylase family protein [Balneolaceae bacterium]
MKLSPGYPLVAQSFATALLVLAAGYSAPAQSTTYAEKLGYPEGTKVVILHIDDVGMSHDSNRGAIKALEEGVANSLSIMMPCSWVPEFAHYYRRHPGLDAGLHLTLTSEWETYRWGPITSTACPSLVDERGAFHASVDEVVQHADLNDVEKEIRAQIELARNMGIDPTHMDTHMGTMFATPEFTRIYVTLGIEYGIPIMLPGGHNTLISRESEISGHEQKQLQKAGQQLWEAGLPVLDDLHNFSYGWKVPPEMAGDDPVLQQYWTQKYIDSFDELQPGITMVITHCTDPSETFSSISDSGPLRKADLLAMTSPGLASYFEREQIILATWKELQKRRNQLK